MASYHRVLASFGRTVRDKAMECDCDIHPWDILINDERWVGKIRLIGFVDIFFLICYTGVSRFERGIVIYKDSNMIRKLLRQTGLQHSVSQLPNEDEENEDHKIEPAINPCFVFKDDKASLDYTIKSFGHPIGIQASYDKKSFQRYTILLAKTQDSESRRRIHRAITQHTAFDLVLDAVRLGAVSTGEMISQVTRGVFGGSALMDTSAKYMGALMGEGTGKNIALSADRV